MVSEILEAFGEVHKIVGKECFKESELMVLKIDLHGGK